MFLAAPCVQLPCTPQNTIYVYIYIYSFQRNPTTNTPILGNPPYRLPGSHGKLVPFLASASSESGTWTSCSSSCCLCGGGFWGGLGGGVGAGFGGVLGVLGGLKGGLSGV